MKLLSTHAEVPRILSLSRTSDSGVRSADRDEFVEEAIRDEEWQREVDDIVSGDNEDQVERMRNEGDYSPSDGY